MDKWKLISGVKWFDAKDKKQAKFGGKSPMLFLLSFFFISHSTQGWRAPKRYGVRIKRRR